VFGRARRRAYTPEEFGRLLAVALPFYRDHLIVQAGTGREAGSCWACVPGGWTWAWGG
jgi:hypothetical protein